MRHGSKNARLWAWLGALCLILLGACGGGGGGDGATNGPYIFASITAFPTNGVPPGFVGAGANSSVIVDVLDNNSGAPIAHAAVTLNGVSLSYNAGERYYEAELTIDPAQPLDLRIRVGGSTYVGSGIQPTSYPTITSPIANAIWSNASTNLLSWTGTVPAPRSLYAAGIFDANGIPLWPPSGALITPANVLAAMVAPGSLSTGNRIAIVGVGTEFGISGAAADSAMVALGFTYVPFTVTTGPSAPLAAIVVTPATPTISPGGTLQLAATGNYSDGSTRDLTAEVNWSTTDVAKVTVDDNGVVTGVDFGSATIQATQGLTSGTVTVNVFQPTPSPVPPLSQSVSYQIDYVHSGFATFGAALNFPSAPKWSVTLGGAASYPLIADGRVFVVSGWPGVPTLHALDKATGATLWGPVAVGGTWAGHAYDNGKVFVVERSGNVRAFNAATGQQLWAAQMPLQSVFDSPPTARDGVVYVTGAGIAGTLFAVNQSNGNVLWHTTVFNGGRSSPAVSDDGVFVSYPCQVYKFHPFTGSTLWHYNGPCGGGGGKTAAYANGKLYVRNPGLTPVAPVFDAATGTIDGDFPSGTIPALSTQTGYALSNGTLRAVDLDSGNTAWSFVGDGQLLLAPVIIDNHVFVGSGTGVVYALDAATGAQAWSGNAGAGIVAADEFGGNAMTGFGAGEGYLVVPAGNAVTAWHLSGP